MTVGMVNVLTLWDPILVSVILVTQDLSVKQVCVVIQHAILVCKLLDFNCHYPYTVKTSMNAATEARTVKAEDFKSVEIQRDLSIVVAKMDTVITILSAWTWMSVQKTQTGVIRTAPILLVPMCVLAWRDGFSCLMMPHVWVSGMETGQYF